jgi:hypothetical protein
VASALAGRTVTASAIENAHAKKRWDGIPRDPTGRRARRPLHIR